MMEQVRELLQRIGGERDLALAFSIIAIIGMLILPLPPFLLDFMLAISITLSVLILMTALLIREAARILRLPDRPAARDAAAPGAQHRNHSPDPRPRP
jgi:flagellar biosynthesis protein FlhA